MNPIENLVEEIESIGDPEKTQTYNKRRLGPILEKLNQPESNFFADYLNNIVIDAVFKNNPIEKILNWVNISNDEKIDFAQKILNNVIDLLYLDIKNDKVTTYNNDGSIYKKTNDFIDNLYKENITEYFKNNLKITVYKKNDGLMHISNSRKLGININWPIYKSFDCFLMDLRHEIMHMVDLFIPQISSLPPDIRMTGIRYYISNEDRFYKDNPLELNADLKRGEFAEICRKKIAMVTKQFQEIQKQRYERI